MEKKTLADIRISKETKKRLSELDLRSPQVFPGLRTNFLKNTEPIKEERPAKATAGKTEQWK
mgnify:CR=1 FL=1